MWVFMAILHTGGGQEGSFQGGPHATSSGASPGWAHDERKFKVFISYSLRDSAPYAQRLVEALEARGLAAKLDTRDIEFGERWQQQLKDFIRQADAAVFIVSPKSIESKWCRWEVAQIAAQSKRVVPVVHISVPADLVPAEISEIQFFQFRPGVDFTSDTEFDALASRLAEGVQKDRGWLQEHTRLNEIALNWIASDRQRDLLLHGSTLSAAERWLASRPATAPSLSGTQVELISASQMWAKQRARRWAIGLSAVAIVALSLAGLAYWQRGVAVQQQMIAQDQRKLADQQRDRAEQQRHASLTNESKALAALSDVALKANQATDALILGLAGWPRRDGDDRPQLKASLQAVAAAMAIMTPALGEYPPALDEYQLDGEVVGARFFRNETRVLAWSRDGTLRIWDTVTGKQAGPTMRHNGMVYGALLTRDESRILSWSTDGMRLWDTEKGEQIGSPMMSCGDGVDGVELTRDENRILSWCGQVLQLWDMTTGNKIGEDMQHSDKSRINGALLFRDESRILSWSYDGTLKLWDVGTSKQIALMKHKGSVNGALLTKDEKRIISWSTQDDDVNYSLRMWDATTGKEFGPAISFGTNAFGGALLSRDGKRILSWTNDALRILDVASGRQIGPTMQHRQEKGYDLKGALFTHDGAHVLSWSGEGTMKLWDVATGRQIGETMKGGGTGALFTRDDSHIISWSGDGTVRVWNTLTGKELGPVMRHNNAVISVVLSQDERRLLSWSSDNTVRLWNVAVARPVGFEMRHDERVYGALLNRDNNRILSWSSDNTLRLWDARTAKGMGPAMKHDGAVGGALFTRDESRILSWSDDGTLRLWDAVTAKQVGPSMRHDKRVSGASFTRDESRILSWSDDNTLRLWDVATARQIGPPMKQDGGVLRALIARDETLVLAPSRDGMGRWDLTSGKMIQPSISQQAGFSGEKLTSDGSKILTWSTGEECDPSELECRMVHRREPISISPVLQLWDVKSGEAMGPSITPENVIEGALFLHNEAQILSWSHDGLRLWDVATAKQIGDTIAQGEAVLGALPTRDETRAMVWSSDNLRLWDLKTGKQIGYTMRHSGIRGVLRTKDETRILSWDSRAARLWDMATFQQIGPTMSHDDFYGALFTSDEARILSWSGDRSGRLQLWDVSWRGKNLFEIACNYSPPNHELAGVSKRYGVKINDPICAPGQAIPTPDWNLIE